MTKPIDQARKPETTVLALRLQDRTILQEYGINIETGRSGKGRSIWLVMKPIRLP
ncbi:MULTISPECIES: hypothetical protein [Methylomicrobium]|uniref:hypothetical protein n=1 Tax=Methylomicrobium TaxID=39773 RepID=UPI0002E405A5|nr:MULTISPECIES: hypothetical protein [Methylomicrobium]